MLSRGTQEQTLVREKLRNLFLISLNPCKYFGYTVFSLSPQTELDFKYFSIPLFVAILRTALVVITFTVYLIEANIFDDFFNNLNNTPISKLCGNLISLNNFFSDTIATIFVFGRRHTIIHFHNRLVCFISEYLKNTFPSAYQQRATNTTISRFTDIFEISFKCIRRVRNIIVFAYFYQVIFGLEYAYQKLSQPNWVKVYTKWSLVIMPMYSIFWQTMGNMRYFARVWVASFFICFKLWAIIIESKLKICSSNKVVNSNDVFIIMKMFQDE